MSNLKLLNSQFVIVSYDSFLKYIGHYITLSDKEIEVFKSLVRIKKVKKRQYVVKQGDICRFENYVVKGCLRCYHVDEKGKEHVVQFAAENRWISDLQSFLTQSTARFNVDTIEPSVLIRFEYNDLQKLYQEIPQFERFFRLIFQNAFVVAQNKILASCRKKVH